MTTAAPPYPDAFRVAWHRAECWGYTADLSLWRELAGREPKRILDLGCGAGRVALDLARRGHRLTGLDHDPALLAALRESDPAIATVHADAGEFELAERFELILAPMQTLQLLTDPPSRRSCLASVRRHLRPQGLFAAAFVEIDRDLVADGRNPLADLPIATDFDQMTPELVASSSSIGLYLRKDRLTIRRRRAIHADGSRPVTEPHELSFELALLDRSEIEAEWRQAGLEPVAWREIEPTESHMGAAVAIAAPSCQSA